MSRDFQVFNRWRLPTDAAQGPFRGMANVDLRSDAELAAVQGANALRKGIGLIGTHQVDGAAGPARARKLASQESGTCLGGFDQRVECLRAVLEVVAAGSVGGRNQAAEFNEVAGSQRNDTLANPLVLAEDVPGALAAQRDQACPSVPSASSRLTSRNECTASAPRLCLKVGHDCLALGAAAIVHAVGQAARVFESQTMIAGPGSPSGKRACSRVLQSR